MSKNELTQMEKEEIKSRVKGMSKIEMLESIKYYPDEVVTYTLDAMKKGKFMPLSPPPPFQDRLRAPF